MALVTVGSYQVTGMSALQINVVYDAENKYEPFLSMELISYAETREYGKKVLANYYIYNNYLNKENPISLSTIFQSLVSPSY